MRISGGRFDPGMPEQLTDHGQGFRSHDSVAGERVPQIVEPERSNLCS
jgi:hypothetical protein